MKSNKPDPSHFQAWKVAFRKNAHLLINVGYSAGRAKITTNEHKEEHITEFIVCSIKDLMRRSDCPSWCKYYSVHEEAPVSGKGSHGKSRPRTDIFIELGSRSGRPEYVFEAKRLRTNGYGAGKYTGVDGHAVTGIDLSADIIEVAERSKAAHPDTPRFGSLRYLCTDVNTWQTPDASVDCVIFNRSLHHISDLPHTMATVKRLLKPGGRIICQDYAYDRFDEQTGCWLYQMQRLLFLSGHYDIDPATLSDEAASIGAMRTAWLTRSSEHHLNQYEEMMSALHVTYHEHYFAWVPYLFVYIGNGIRRVSLEQERELLTFLKRMEQYLIDHDAILAVGFRFVGSASS